MIVNNKTYDDVVRQFPGAFDVIELTINGEDITDQYVQIDIFESIFSIISGRITMVDTKNLPANLPIVGDEIVTIKITDGVNTEEHRLRCYSITDRVSINHNTIKYTMHLCSEEMFADSFVRVSKSYYLSKLETNVRDILGDVNYLNSNKPAIIADTEEDQCIVIPTWSPLHAINWMASRARSNETQYKGGNFVFYETMSGFRWVPLENLYNSDENKVYGRIIYDPMRPLQSGTTQYDERTRTDVMSFMQWEKVKSFNVLDNAKEGMYGNTVKVIDIIERRFDDYTFDYNQSFYDHQHLKGINGINAKPLNGSFSGQQSFFPEAHLRVGIKHKGLFNAEPEGNSKIDEWMPPKISQMQQMENHVIKGTLPGHIGLEAGMIIDFDMPNPENRASNTNPGPDPAYSGEYLVTHVRRSYQRESFTMTIQMMKDSRGVDASEIFT